MAKLAISPDLEYSIVHAVLNGILDPGAVDAEELSGKGRTVLEALALLEAPYQLRAVYLACTDVLGADRDTIRDYLGRVAEANAGLSVPEILALVRDKQLLVELVNLAGEQIHQGKLDIGAVTALLTREGGHTLAAVSEGLRHGLPPPPQGSELRSLPRLTALTGGLYGLWAIAGEPGAGKSALAWQIILDTARGMPALLYDFENGLPVLMARSDEIFRGDLGRLRTATESVYVRDSIRTMDSDLAAVKPPALVVIDSVQKLPSSILHRREGLDGWVHRMEGLKKRGYSILLVSEIPRSSYESEPRIGDFKESGEIEYSADLGMRVVPRPDNSVDIHIVKNRHRPHKGYSGHLERHNSWLFREVA